MRAAKSMIYSAFSLLIFMVCVASSGSCLPQVQAPKAEVATARTGLSPALILWSKGDYAGAIAEFQMLVQLNPNDEALQMTFVRTAADVSDKEARLSTARAMLTAAQKAPKTNAAAGQPPALSGQERGDAELKEAEAALRAVHAALADLAHIYRGWADSNPKKAIYPYELAILTKSTEIETREKYLLKAVALDPKFTEAYQELYALILGVDQAASARYAKKAADSKPNDFRLKLTYAATLWIADEDAARKYYRTLAAQHAGTVNGFNALQWIANETQDPKEKAALLERIQREYSKEWATSDDLKRSLYEQYMLTDPAKGFAFARNVLGVLEATSPKSDEKTYYVTTDLRRSEWRFQVDYAQALVHAGDLTAAGKGAEALALLENAATPEALQDNPQFTLLKAGATEAASGTAAAYEILSAKLVKDLSEEYQNAIVKYGTKLEKSPAQVSEELWSRRMREAAPFKEFELPKLNGSGSMKLSELRGKVVLLNFWFPG
jgi:hypothetical protein